jgi:hypothetical protein
MEPGFLLELKDGNMAAVGEWVGGPPEKGLFGTVKLRGKRRLKTETWRCTRCGYLESYAPE